MRKKSYLLLATTLLAGGIAIASCDQDETLDDGWKGNERKSLATKTRSVSDENNSPKIVYLLPGSAREYEYYGPRNEICLTIG